MDAAQRIDVGDRPIACENEIGARLAQALPGIGIGPALLPDHVDRGLERQAHGARRMRRLHRSDDAKLLEARNVGRLDDFDMLDAMAAVAPAIALHRRLIAVERRPDRAVADRMYRNLQA